MAGTGDGAADHLHRQGGHHHHAAVPHLGAGSSQPPFWPVRGLLSDMYSVHLAKGNLPRPGPVLAPVSQCYFAPFRHTEEQATCQACRV